MTQAAGRNDLCPCGSGKKLKHCHPEGHGKTSTQRNVVILAVAAALAALGAVVILRQDRPAPPPAGQLPPMTAPQAGGAPAPSQGAGTPQPGPAPPGKVWSVEHGHWHDAPAGAGTVTTPGTQVSPGQIQTMQVPDPVIQGGNTPQPPGPVPEGKVWSPEHGHWHDAPAATPAQPEAGSDP